MPGTPSPYISEAGATSSGLAVEEEPLPLAVAPPAPRRVLVTGAGGFIGRHLLPRLLARGHRLRALSRRPPTSRLRPGLEWRLADVTRSATLRGAADDCDVVLHLAGVFTERDGQTFERVHVHGTRALLAEARRASVARFILVSVLGSASHAPPFFRSKWEAERDVRRSGLEYVILRPSVVHGPGDHFTSALVQLLRALPIFPLLGDGSFKMQPVAVEDLADALCQAVERPDVAGHLYELAGPEGLSFRRIVRMVARALRLRRAILRLPRRLAAPALWLAARRGWPAPITPEQLDMLRSVSVLGSSENPLRSVFRVMPLPFGEALTDYLQMGRTA